jgi:hypothetical protein
MEDKMSEHLLGLAIVAAIAVWFTAVVYLAA